MRRSRWAWLAPTLVLAIASAALWFSREQPASDEAPIATAEPARAFSRGGTTAANVAPPVLHPPLTAEAEARMPTALRDLVSQADAGNPGAACRLGSLLAQCGLLPAQWHSEEFVASLRKREKSAAERGDLASANEEAQSLLIVQARLDQCGGIPDELYPRAHAYLRQAALAGERQALVQYIRGESFPPLGMIDNHQFRSPDFDIWRAEAHGLLEAQFRDGRPEAALMLLEAHSTAGGNLPLVTSPDPLLDHAYLLLVQRLFEDFEYPENWSPAPPEADIAAEADALARRWHRENFKDRKYSMRRDLTGFQRELLHPGHSLWPGLESTEPGCSDPSETGP